MKNTILGYIIYCVNIIVAWPRITWWNRWIYWVKPPCVFPKYSLKFVNRPAIQNDIYILVMPYMWFPWRRVYKYHLEGLVWCLQS